MFLPTCCTSQGLSFISSVTWVSNDDNDLANSELPGSYSLLFFKNINVVHEIVLNLVKSSAKCSSVAKKAQMPQMNKDSNFLNQCSAKNQVMIHCSWWLPFKQKHIEKHENAEGERTDGDAGDFQRWIKASYEESCADPRKTS